jgi:hypothetical protein
MGRRARPGGHLAALGVARARAGPATRPAALPARSRGPHAASGGARRCAAQRPSGTIRERRTARDDRGSHPIAPQRAGTRFRLHHGPRDRWRPTCGPVTVPREGALSLPLSHANAAVGLDRAYMSRGMECDSDEASRPARQRGSGCRTDGLACTARPVMVSLRGRTGGPCCGTLRNEAPSIAATVLETLHGVG